MPLKYRPDTIYLPRQMPAKQVGGILRCDNIGCPHRASGPSSRLAAVICEPPVFFWRGPIEHDQTGSVFEVAIALCCDCSQIIGDDGSFNILVL